MTETLENSNTTTLDSLDWVPAQLADLVEIKHGWPFKSEFFCEDLTGRPIVIGVGNFCYTGGFRFESTTSKEYRADYPNEFELAPNDILVVMTCQTSGGEILGIPGRIPDDGRVYLHNQRLGKARIVQPKKLDDKFLYWLFHWPKFNRHLYVTSSGTKILHTAPKRIEAFRFLLPPMVEQVAIAHMLGTLDDKIELNQQMNFTLEQIARAIFKSWFVDFDPVRAKSEGRKSPCLDSETAALFPDSFTDSPLGSIPKTWEVWRVADIGSVICGKTPSTQVSDYYGHDVPFITIPDMHGKVFVVRTQKYLSNAGAMSQPKKMLPKGGICVSCIATPGLVIITSEDAQTNQQINTVVPRSLDETYFWYWSLRNLGDEIRAGGSGGSVLSNMSTGRFGELRVLAPPAVLRLSYCSLVASMFQRILANEQESMTLVAIRDTLLPKLLSGEIRIRDAEKTVVGFM